MIAFDDGSGDDWARIGNLIDGYNKNRQSNIAASNWRVLDESMSAFIPRTSKTGGLPHLSYIKQKPEPLGTEFKVRIAFKQTFLLNPFILTCSNMLQKYH